MMPEPSVLDDLLSHRAFTMNASHKDCEDVVLAAYRQGAKDALDEAVRVTRWYYPADSVDQLVELREQVDE